MTILVTGANGFVGRALAAHLASQGRALVLATRRGGPAPADASVRSAAVGDLGPATDWSAALDGVDAVVHAAARVHHRSERAGPEIEAAYDQVNRAASVALYDQAARAGVRAFMFISTILVLGSRTAPGRPFRDDDPPSPETGYARSKLGAERDLLGRAAAGGPPVVVLRPPLVAGRGARGNLASLMRLADTPLPLPFADTGNRRSLLSLPNLAAAVEHAVDHPDPHAVGGVYNLADERPVSTGDIVAALRSGLGRPARLFRLPAVLRSGAETLPGVSDLTRRLFGDLEVDGGAFRERFRHRDLVTTPATLADMARHHRAGS